MTPTKLKRSECEVYSRVTGYLRPVKQWNDAKRQEYVSRVTYDVGKSLTNFSNEANV